MLQLLLFVHVLAVAMLFSGITLELAGFVRLQRATTLVDARAATINFGLVGPLMGLGSLLLIAAGIAMVYVTGYGWTPAWISVTAIITIILAVNGPLLNGRRSEHILKLTSNAGEAAITPELNRARNDRVLEYSLFLTVYELIAALFMMTVKPQLLVCIGAVILAAIVAAIPAGSLIRRGAGSAAP